MIIIEPAQADDRQGILAVIAQIDMFNQEEKDTVRELWDEGSYHFLVARQDGQVIGFTCFAERGLTQGAYDLYWIAVAPSVQRQGVGEALMWATESEVRKRGGRLILVETSGTEAYAATRAFYEAIGYQREAVIRDFYRLGDDLVIYAKRL